MLVLRRRPRESILFDGGVKLTVVALQDHRAWIALSAPSLESELVLAVLAVSGESACIGLRGPRRISSEGPAIDITTDSGADTVLLVNRRLGETIRIPGVVVSIGAIESDRAQLALEFPSIEGTIGISIFPVAGAEVKIGIDAPRHLRVFRQEVWEDLEAANAGASEKWSEADLAALSAGRPPRR